MMGRLVLLAALAGPIAAAAGAAGAQAARPWATLVASPAPATVAAGESLALALRVTLPPEVHVQAHAPRDPLLVPTVLTVEAPSGMTVIETVYPAPAELEQSGRADALLVLGPEFEIEVRLAVAPDAAAGSRRIPVVLRYQACTDEVCFPPARATAAWTVAVESSSAR